MEGLGLGRWSALRELRVTQPRVLFPGHSLNLAAATRTAASYRLLYRRQSLHYRTVRAGPAEALPALTLDSRKRGRRRANTPAPGGHQHGQRARGPANRARA